MESMVNTVNSECHKQMTEDFFLDPIWKFQVNSAHVVAKQTSLDGISCILTRTSIKRLKTFEQWWYKCILKFPWPNGIIKEKWWYCL